MTLTEFVTAIGDRWARGVDPTSTGATYGYGLKLRVLPALGHLPVTQITAGVIDRTIDAWENRHGASTIKNSIAPLVRVLDEAVRDGLSPINPAKNRAKRSLNRNAFRLQPAEDTSPRARAIPDMGTLTNLAEACGKIHQSYSNFVVLAALLAARSSEVSGLQAGDVRFDKNVVVIARQTYPGKGGLITKQTKGRRERRVPILDTLRPILERLGRQGARGPAAGRPEGRRSHNRDRAGRDELGPDRQRSPPARPHPARPPAHRRDLDGRRRHPAARPPGHPRPRLGRDHPRILAPRRPPPGLRRGAGQRLTCPIRQGQQIEPARGLEGTVRVSREPRSGLWSPFGPLIQRRPPAESQMQSPTSVSKH